jgi:hypothetical protein
MLLIYTTIKMPRNEEAAGTPPEQEMADSYGRNSPRENKKTVPIYHK